MTKQLIQTLLIMSSKEKLPFKLHNLGSIFNQHSFKEKIDIDKVSPLVDEKAEKWVEDNPAINAFFRNASQEDNIPSENQLYVVGGYDVATTFLDSIWERDKDKGFFSDTDFDYFSQYCGYLTGDPASIDDWRECYLQLNGIKIPSDVSPPQSIDKHLISYHDAFEIMRMQAEWHYREFGFEFPQLLALLDSMIENPQSHIGEWILWQQAVQSVNPSCKMDFCKGFSEVISSDFDRNKTLDELEQDDWGEPNYGSFLVTECYRLRRVPLRKFTAGNLRILIGQNISLKYLIPLALEQLDKNPFVEGDYYDGDLLLAVIGADPEFWKKEPHLHKKAVEIAQRALCAEYKKQEDFDTEINLFQELIDFVNKSGFATYQPKSWGAIRRFEELIDAADEGKSISEEELSFILEVIKTSPDDYELGKAITILGKCGDSRYQKILEPFIRYPTFWPASSAFEALYECWGLTKDYLDDIKFYIRGEAEWDTSSYFRSSSITYAEEFLKKNYDSELIHLLLGIFKADEDKMMGYKPDEGIIRSPIHKELIKGKDFSSYVRLRSNAYAALAVAVGEYEISYDHIFKAIEENHLNALDFSIIQKAEKMIQNRI